MSVIVALVAFAVGGVNANIGGIALAGETLPDKILYQKAPLFVVQFVR